MNILERITQLRTARNWSEYQLAEKSGLTQSTISSWYHKNLLPSIPSLEKICDAFGMSLSEFFVEPGDTFIPVNEKQSELLVATDRLNDYQMQLITDFIKSIDC